MDLRSCRNLHFIAAIKGGSVTKCRNVDSRGKPALVFKTLIDIYESEDATRVASHSSSTSQDGYADSAFNYKRVKIEGSCLPVVDRTLREVDHAANNFICHGDDDERESDSDDCKMTLKQLKERCKTKKRKLLSTMDSNPKQVCDKLESGEDDFDLKETLGSWKLKLSKKKSKAKRKCINRSVINSELALTIKSEPVLYSENFMQANWDLMSLVHVKREDPESEFLGSPRPIAFIEDSIFKDMSDEILETDECHNRQLVLSREQYLNSSFIKVSCDSSGQDLEKDECDNCQQVLFAKECQNCAVNEVSYDHLEPLECIALLPANSEEIVQVSNQTYSSQSFLISPISEPDRQENSDNQLSWESSLEITLPAKDQSSKMFSCSDNSSHSPKILGQTNLTSGVQALDRAADTKDETREHLPLILEICSSSSPVQSSNPSISQTCFSPDDDNVSLKDNTANQEQSLTRGSADARKDFLSPGNQFVSIEDDSPTYKTQPPLSTITNSERSSSPSSQPAAGANASSNSTSLQTPERLPSKRKAISPTSQEQLRVAMNNEELYGDEDYYKCKEKLYYGKPTECKPPTMSLSSVPASRAENSIQSGQMNRTKVTISPSQILKISKNGKRGSPPKGNLEGPRISRSIPRVSTGCNSIKSCSESAITFSQRQMVDIESLAERLVNELKSMKDIVEQKLLFESYRSLPLKNDADEVKTAIKNATKVEETARKWLSVMARDCNRFCKIMRLTQNGPAASKNQVRPERKKISFADEAGGMLCHVKFFENDMTSPESPIKKQKDQI